jgi:hypothetical protein
MTSLLTYLSITYLRDGGRLWLGRGRRIAEGLSEPQREVGLLALIFRKNVKPSFFFQLEFVRILRSARANQPLPFGRTGNVFNVRSITVNQAEIFHHVLHAAIWTFNVQTSSKHRDAPEFAAI